MHLVRPLAFRSPLPTTAPGPYVLQRSSAVVSETGDVEARFTVGLPARGRTVLGQWAAQILTHNLPRCRCNDVLTTIAPCVETLAACMILQVCAAGLALLGPGRRCSRPARALCGGLGGSSGCTGSNGARRIRCQWRHPAQVCTSAWRELRTGHTAHLGSTCTESVNMQSTGRVGRVTYPWHPPRQYLLPPPHVGRCASRCHMPAP